MASIAEFCKLAVVHELINEKVHFKRSSSNMFSFKYVELVSFYYYFV